MHEPVGEFCGTYTILPILVSMFEGYDRKGNTIYSVVTRKGQRGGEVCLVTSGHDMELNYKYHKMR